MEAFHIIYLETDGSRRVRDRTVASGNTWDSSIYLATMLSGGLPAVTWEDLSVINIADIVTGQYLPYPPAMGNGGGTQVDPVNQIPYMQEWEAHTCRMAHDVNQFNLDAGEHRLSSSWAVVPGGAHSAETQIRNQNALQVFRAIIGDTLRRLDRWNALDREGGSTFTTDWLQQLPGIRNIVENKLCAACEHPYSIREFARLHDYSAWRTILDHRRVLDEGTGSAIMRVPTIVRDTEPWQPHATENLVFFGGTDLDAGWRLAIEWFDEAVHRYDRKYAQRYLPT